MSGRRSLGGRGIGPVSLEEIHVRGLAPGVMSALLQGTKQRLEEESEDLSCVIAFISQEDITPERIVRAAKYIAAHPEVLRVTSEKKDEAGEK